MANALKKAPIQLNRVQRLLLAVVGGTLLALLATATWLRPDPNGLGTHQQLGLPPCSFRVLLHIRCPACGMTTSWAHVVRGQLGAACRANLGGTLLALFSLALGPWALAAAVRGRWFGQLVTEWTVLAAVLLILVVTVLDWTGRLLIAKWSENASACSIQAKPSDPPDHIDACPFAGRLPSLLVDSRDDVRQRLG